MQPHTLQASAGFSRSPRSARSFFGRLIIAGFLGLAAATLPAQPSATGGITGKVFNPSTSEYVRNAEVRVVGTDLIALTEDGGLYRLVNVPAGEVTLSVTYTGYATITQQLTVAAGATAVRDFEMTAVGSTEKRGDEVVRLEKYVVSTEREGNAKALAEQKAAMNVKSVVASDSFGDIAEGNIGEFLKFLPGINIDYVETDTRAASIGGLEARYGSVTLDGGSMANTSTGTFGESSRQFEFEAVSIDNIESIEVNKTLSADMLADSPAGTINLRTKSALDRKGRRINWSVSLIGNQYEHSLSSTPRHDDTPHAKLRPSARLDFSDTFFNNKLGVAFNISRTDVFKEQFRHALTYDYTSTQAQAAGTPLITAINFKDGPKMAEKTATGLKLDYQATPFLRLTLASSYILFSDEIANRNLNFRVSAAQLGAGSNTVNVIANPVAGTGTRIEQSGSTGNKKTDTSNLALSFVYKQGRLTLDGQSSYSRARQKNGSDHLAAVATANLQLTRISYTATRPSVDSPAWTFTQTGGGNWFDYNTYGANDAQTNNISNGQSRAQTEEYVNQVNAQYVLPWKVPTFIKTGLWSRLTTRGRYDVSQYTGTWVGPTGSSLTSRMPQSIAGFRISPAWGGNIFQLPVPDKSQLYALLQAHPEYFTRTTTQAATDLDGILDGRQNVDEFINAAYVLGNIRLGRAQLQAGLRYEDTATTVKVPTRIPDAKNPFPANTIERVIYRWSEPRTETKGGYGDLLPSASLRYQVSPNLIARLGYNKGVKRPRLDRLAGLWEIDEANLEINLPNPDLKPERSDKYSLSLEYYFEPAGSLSAHVFQTDLDRTNSDLIGPFPASDFGFEDDPLLSQYDFFIYDSLPGGRRVRGLELAYNQQLSFFHSELLRNTRVFATWSQYTSTPRPNNFRPRNASAGISTRYKKFSAGIKGTWTDDYRTGGNTVATTSKYFPGDLEFIKERYIFDIDLGYRFSRRFEMFVAGRNAFNSGRTWFFKESDGRIRQMEKYGGQWTIGVKGTL